MGKNPVSQNMMPIHHGVKQKKNGGCPKKWRRETDVVLVLQSAIQSQTSLLKPPYVLLPPASLVMVMIGGTCGPSLTKRTSLKRIRRHRRADADMVGSDPQVDTGQIVRPAVASCPCRPCVEEEEKVNERSPEHGRRLIDCDRVADRFKPHRPALQSRAWQRFRLLNDSTAPASCWASLSFRTSDCDRTLARFNPVIDSCTNRFHFKNCLDSEENQVRLVQLVRPIMMFFY